MLDFRWPFSFKVRLDFQMLFVNILAQILSIIFH